MRRDALLAALWTGLLLSATALPEVPLGAGDLGLYYPIAVLAAGYFLLSMRVPGRPPAFIKMLLVLVILFAGLQTASMVVGPFAPPVLSLSAEWNELYNKTTFDSFYRDEFTSILRLAQYTLYVLTFYFGAEVSARLEKARSSSIVSRVLTMSLLFQFLVGCVQFAQGVERPNGLMSDSQTLSFYALFAYIVLLSVRDRSPLYKTALGTLVGAVIYISGTRSSLVILAFSLLIAFMPESRWLRRCVQSLPLLAWSLTVALSFDEGISTAAVAGLSIITSPLSIYLRTLMWQEFSGVFVAAPLWGAYGYTVYFTDNTFWHFCISYGFFGILFLVLLFWHLHKSVSLNRFHYYLIPLLSLAGLTHFGFFNGALGVTLFLFLGFFWKRSRSGH